MSDSANAKEIAMIYMKNHDFGDITPEELAAAYLDACSKISEELKKTKANKPKESADKSTPQK